MNSVNKFGVSFSLHRCSELGIDKKTVLTAALNDLGFRRFRLMSYWNIHEKKPGQYNFEELDWQLDLIGKYKGSVSLCVGKRQPRWPECHIPNWAAELPKEQWYDALYAYIEIVVNRYKNHPAIVSWQLENEALLREFGHCVDQDYSHDRLETEFKLIKSLDPKHPVIMTLSDSWGLPWRNPKPDIYAISLYRKTLNKKGNYVNSKRPATFYKLRAALIYLLRGRQVFIHELQTEPWLSESITQAPLIKQLEQFNPDNLKGNVAFATKTGLEPIDLWGLEWWYLLKIKGHPEYWDIARGVVRDK